MTDRIEKKGFEWKNILSDLREERVRCLEIEGIVRAYEEGMRQCNAQLKEVFKYGRNEIVEEEKNLNRPSIGDEKLRVKRSSSEISGGMREKVQALEVSSNEMREENERLRSELEISKTEADKLRADLNVSLELNKKQQQSISEKDENIAYQNVELERLKGIEKQLIESVNLIKEQLNKKIEQLSEIETDRNQLIERYLVEKCAFAEKMNVINQMQEDLDQKMNRLTEEEEYLLRRKQSFQSEVVKSGVKTIQIAPTLAESKVVLSTQSDMPLKPSKILLKHHKNEIYCIAQTLNGNMIASVGGDNVIKLYDPLTMNAAGIIQSSHDDNLYLHVCFAPFNDLLVAGLTDKTIQLYNYQTQKLRATFQGHNDRVNVVSFTSEKEKIVSASADRSLKIWDINKVSTIKALMCGSIVRSLDYFQSEPHVITGHNDGSIRLYSTRDSANVKPIFNLQGMFDGGVTCVKLSNCHNYILASSADGFAVKCIDLRQNKILRTFENNAYFNNHEFNKCCFGLDDKYVIAGCSDSTIFIWNFVNGTKKAILKNPNHQGVIIAVEFHNISGNLYSGDSRGNLLIWN